MPVVVGAYGKTRRLSVVVRTARRERSEGVIDGFQRRDEQSDIRIQGT